MNEAARLSNTVYGVANFNGDSLCINKQKVMKNEVRALEQGETVM